MKRKFLCILMSICILLCFSLVPISRAESLEEQKNQAKENREKAEEKLQYVEEELTSSVVKIQELDDKIRTAQQEIAEMDVQLNELNTKVEETTNNLEKVQENYDTNREIMEQRLIIMYECGDITYLDLLLHSSSLVEFLSNYYIIEQIVQSDNEILEKIEQEKEEIEKKKRQLEEEKAQLKLLKVKQEQLRVIMQNNKTVQENEIAELSDQEKELQQKIQEYKNEEARIESLIQLAANGYEYSGEYTGGVMIWPVGKSGTVITSGYGTRQHPIQGISKFHTGIDIGNAGFGAPVIAAADGVVSLATYYGGYRKLCYDKSWKWNIYTIWAWTKNINNSWNNSKKRRSNYGSWLYRNVNRTTFTL